MDYGFEYITKQPLSMQAFTPSVVFCDNKKVAKTMFYLTSVVPTNALEKIARIPGIGSAKLLK